MRIALSSEISPACEYCINAKQLINSGDMLCRKLGVVDKGFSCSGFKYDPLKRKPLKRRKIEQYSQSDFSLD